MRFRFFALIMLSSSSVLAQTAPYLPYANGMRVVVGGQGALLRAAPLTYTCSQPPVECTQRDVIAPNTYGVVQSDAPVLDAGNNWYWLRVIFDASTANGQNTGWVSAIPPYVNSLNPPQMVPNVSFQLVANYDGPALTGAVCLIDGQSFPATRQLVASVLGQQGTLLCPASMPGVGGHKAVIQAINSVGTAGSTEFQYEVTTSPTTQPPTMPMNLRIQ